MTFNIQQALIHALRQVIGQPFERNHYTVREAIRESLPNLNPNTKTQMHQEIRIGLSLAKTPKSQRYAWRELQNEL